MIIYEKQNALKVFYYLLAIDGKIDEIELNKFIVLGQEIDTDFGDYKEELIDSCQRYLSSYDVLDNYYDLVQEGVDATLGENKKSSDGLTARELIWNMFVVAFSNAEYKESEKRLIEHVGRISKVEKSVIVEMEQTIRTAMSVQKELDTVKNLNRPYGEVRPIVEELENRLDTIMESVKELVADEMGKDEPYEFQPDFVDKARMKINDKVAPVVNKVGEAAKNIAGDTVEKLNPLAEQAKDIAGGFIKKITPKGFTKRKEKK